jgi:small subunit ribosomal protein S17
MARSLIGTVASDKADKTIVVAVATRKTHPLYKKQYTITTRFAAHDEKNEAKAGDKVEITECRPLSASKRFTLTKVIERAGVIHTSEADAEAVKAVSGEKPAKVTEETTK